MKIQNEESVVNLNSVQKKLPEKETVTKSPEKVSGEGDKVQLSPGAREFQRIKDALETAPDVRESKVAGISESIEKGSYKADSSKIAESIINESILDLFA